MKKILSFVASVFAFVALTANPIDPTTAEQLARTFWAKQCSTKAPATFQNVSHVVGVSQMYIFNNEAGTGFVIMSADDNAYPVLAYSEESNFSIEDIPAHVRWWLSVYEAEINSVASLSDAVTEVVAMQWENLRAGNLPIEPQERAAVSPLLSSKWDQLTPFNQLCPTVSGTRCPTGCVATAMAQIMNYYEYPTRGTGSHSYTWRGSGSAQTLSVNFAATTYDWANMKDNYTFSNTAQKTAVATLMYHCGVSVDMSYTANGSGAIVGVPAGYYSQTRTAIEAFKQTFGYTNAQYKYKNQYNGDWATLLKNELNASRPILYAGSDSQQAGHAFICDGYDATNKFHFNWGWGGAYDGYFALTSLAPEGQGTGGGSGNYTQGQEVIINLSRPSGTDISENTLNDLNIYPNPANDRFTISTNSAIQQVEIFSMTSELLYKHNNVTAGEEINIADLAAGIYFVKTTTEKGISTQKLIVQ